MKRPEDINAGDKFNCWVVLSTAAKRSVNEYYLCKCICGTEREVFRGSLLGGRSKSCGCLQRGKRGKKK